ncbi:MAG: hypothetical protein MK198_03620 [Gracilimonas sp.]|uniref:hypothetical protein n=1 Tax=Gracilimonas sp. TaxID=1974203 RepID=UPI00375172FB|nr:hypothetical protein [Gracilimonas sp.]
MPNIIRPEKVSIKNSSELNEKFIQEEIAKDPSILGLGDLILKDKERIQPKAGRLDLLLQDPDSNRRYEVELQLGASDESHIIRTIEYWDIEKKRYPQYDHCAVIIAEDITSRFLNVVGLFNGFIPLIAIQMNAYKIHGDYGLIFTKVLDEMPLGLVDEDEEVQEVTDRGYWLKERGTSETVKMADKMLEIVNEISRGYSLKYNKHYIGLEVDGQPNNFVQFRPKKKYMRFEIRHPKSEEVESIIDSNDLDDMGYDNSFKRYRINLHKKEISEKQKALKELVKIAHDYRNG